MSQTFGILVLGAPASPLTTRSSARWQLQLCQVLVFKQVRHKDTRDHVQVSLSAPAWKFDIPVAIVHRTQDNPQCEAPKIAKLVYKSHNYGLWTIVTGAYKPTYNWGASHCMNCGTSAPVFGHSLVVSTFCRWESWPIPSVAPSRSRPAVEFLHPHGAVEFQVGKTGASSNSWKVTFFYDFSI